MPSNHETTPPVLSSRTQESSRKKLKNGHELRQLFKTKHLSADEADCLAEDLDKIRSQQAPIKNAWEQL